MTNFAIIGGTGLNKLEGLQITNRRFMRTPFGEPSGPLIFGEINGKDIVFLARHGSGHTIPPHKINYRANLWALKEIGVTEILAIAAVGGISENLPPSTLAVPDQIIDYTWGRDMTFYEDTDEAVVHIDFTQPYSQKLRQTIISAANNADIEIIDRGTYGTTQGPRLETAAEIDRLERDGCTLVGMTGMPEAALARELDIHYATCAVVANYAAGRDGDEISMQEIEHNLIKGMQNVRDLLTVILNNR